MTGDESEVQHPWPLSPTRWPECRCEDRASIAKGECGCDDDGLFRYSFAESAEHDRPSLPFRVSAVVSGAASRNAGAVDIGASSYNPRRHG